MSKSGTIFIVGGAAHGALLLQLLQSECTDVVALDMTVTTPAKPHELALTRAMLEAPIPLAVKPDRARPWLKQKKGRGKG